MSPDQVDAIAREIRKYYLERKSLLFGGSFRLTGRNAEFAHWQRAAEICIGLEATPETYVDAAFAYCRLSTGPYPNTMYGPCAKSWYLTYIKTRDGIKHAQDRANAAGRDPRFDPAASPHLDSLKSEIQFVKHSLIRLTGTSEVNEVTIEYINSFTTSYPAHVRALMGYKNEKVKKFFGSEAYDNFVNSPGLQRAAESLGYPVREILLWLNAPPH